MYFSEQHKAVVYTLRNPAQVVQCLPEAQQLDAHRVAVPVRYGTMEMCNRLGLPIVNPMRVEYDWPAKPGLTPFKHQAVMSGFAALYRKHFNLSDMGTGKTLSCLWTADYLMRLGLVKKVLIICTLSTMDDVWAKELAINWLAGRTSSLLHGTAARRFERLGQDVDFYILNHDGVSVRGVGEALIKRTDIDLVIVDEASAFKHSSTLRYRNLRRILASKPRAWLLTGTPAANSPTDAWGIAKLIDATPMSQFAFRDRTMIRISQFKWVPRADAASTVAATLQPSIRFNRDDCIDLPPITYETRQSRLSERQKSAYEDMKEALSLTMRDGTVIDAVNEAVLRNKLIQISCGALYGPDHEIHHLDAGPKLDELDQVLDSISEKVIVFAPLTSVVHVLYRHISKEHSAGVITGAVSQKERTRIFGAFQTTDSPRIIVADPRAMAHGLTLTAASCIVWFGPIDSLEIYLQANARINRPGQVNKMLIVHLASTPVEKEIYRRLAEKESLQGAVLQIVEEK